MPNVVGSMQNGQEDRPKHSIVNVGASPTKLRTRTHRHSLMMANNSQYTLYMGDETVDVATGFPVAPGAQMSMDMGDGDIFLISESETCEVRLLEV